MHSSIILRICKHCGLEATSESDLDLFVTAKDCNYGRKPLCKSCRQERRTDKQSKEYAKKYYMENKEKISEQKKKYWNDNKDYFSMKAKELYETQREERIDKAQEWAEANRGKSNAIKSKNKIKRSLRVPSWLDEDDLWLIEQFYITAKERTEHYGIEFEVDHIIPLNGKYVSGLHVPENLQVITRYENNRKSNHFTVNGNITQGADFSI